MTTAGVVFFDLIGTLVDRTAKGWVLGPRAAQLLDVPAGTRLGVLCNMPPGQRRSEVLDLLRTVGIEERFDTTLLVVATDLGVPLPDRRAFAVATALAEQPAEKCLFVSSNATRLLAAAAAGMRTF